MANGHKYHSQNDWQKYGINKSSQYDSQSDNQFVTSLWSLFEVSDITVKSCSVCDSLVASNKRRHINFTAMSLWVIFHVTRHQCKKWELKLGHCAYTYWSISFHDAFRIVINYLLCKVKTSRPIMLTACSYAFAQ